MWYQSFVIYCHYIVLSFSLLLSVSIQAAPPLTSEKSPFVSNRYPITLVTGNNYRPFADHALAHGGMSVEIVRAAFLSSGYEARILFMPWKRGFIGVQRQIYEGTFPHFFNEEWAQEYLYSDPIYPGHQRIYVSANSHVKFNRIADLVGLRLCSPIGHAIDGTLQKLIDTAAISIISPSSTKLCAKMLERNRVDFMALDETVYNHMFSELNLKAVGKPLAKSDLYLLLPHHDPNSEILMDAFNRGLGCIKTSGLFDKIVQQHLNQRASYYNHR